VDEICTNWPKGNFLAKKTGLAKGMKVKRGDQNLSPKSIFSTQPGIETDDSFPGLLNFVCHSFANNSIEIAQLRRLDP